MGSHPRQVMIEGGTGGNTTLAGLHFEKKVDLIVLLKKIKEYSIQKSTTAGHDVFFNKKKVAWHLVFI